MRRILLFAVLACLLPLSPNLAAQAAKKPAPKKTAKPTPKSAPKTAEKPAEKPAPKPAVEKAVPFQVGETLTYDVAWSNYVTAGTVTTTVKEKKVSNGVPAWYVVAEARPTPLVAKLYPLYYKFDTFLDAFTLLPQRGSVYTEEGKRHRYGITRFDRAARKVFWEYQTTTTVKSDFAVAPDTQDALSAVFALRTLPLKPGDRMTMPVSDNGDTFKATVEVGAAEAVKTASGEVRAIRVKPSIVDAKGAPVGRNVEVWISDDARRLPVKFVAELPVGNFTVVLHEAK